MTPKYYCSIFRLAENLKSLKGYDDARLFLSYLILYIVYSLFNMPVRTIETTFLFKWVVGFHTYVSSHSRNKILWIEVPMLLQLFLPRGTFKSTRETRVAVFLVEMTGISPIYYDCLLIISHVLL